METKKLSLETSHLLFVKDFLIQPTDGGEDFFDRYFPLGNEFYRWIDPDFDKWDLIPINQKTGWTRVAIFKQTKDSILREFINSLDRDISLLSVATHQQVSAFMYANLDLLINTHSSVHFLFENQNQKKYVITISGDIEEGLDMYLRNFDSNTPWRVCDINYFVVPLMEHDKY